MFIALLDSCVLWPSTLRDFILSLAIEQTYTPAWSSAILDEVERNEAEKLIERGPELSRIEAERRAARLVGQMRSMFPDAETKGWEPLEGTFGLPDVDDEHVVAAAVLARAGAIVTENMKDFPATQIPPQIKILSAREFCRDTVEMNPQLALRAVREMAGRSGKHGPRRDENTILDVLAQRYKLTEATELIRESMGAPLDYPRRNPIGQG